MRYIVLVASLLFSITSTANTLATTAQHPVLTPFRATFQAKVKPWNLNGLATYELRQIDEKRYQLSLSLDHAFMDIREKSTFEVIDNCAPKPIHYEYTRDPAIGRKRTHQVHFNFDTKTARFSNNGKKGELSIPPTITDQLSLLVAFRCRQFEGRPLHFDVFARKRIKAYQFKLEATESVATALGPIQSQRFIRQRPDKHDSERTTRFWLAPLYSMQLVQAFQDEGNSKTKLNLVSIQPSLRAFTESQP